MTNEKWRLIAEVTGFTAIVLSLLLVAVEMNQTQKAMEAAAMDARNERTVANAKLGIEYELTGVFESILNGSEISVVERLRAQTFVSTLLRHFETIHFQRGLGLAEDEMWEANLRGLEGVINAPWFDHIFPEWSNNIDSSTFRISFVELVETLKK